MDSKEFKEICTAWCNDTKQAPTIDVALNFKQMLDKYTTPTKFILRSARVGLNTVNTICRILREKKNVTKLDLHENIIRDKGIDAIADLLRENNSITCLDLGSNDIGSKGAAKLSQILADPKCKIKFFLFGSEEGELFSNKLDTDTGVMFADALKRNQNLICLDFNRNVTMGKKNQQAFLALAEAFKKYQNIITLRLGNTNLSTNSAIYLLECLSLNGNLRYLDLHGNGLTTEVGEALENYFAHPNCRLSTLLIQKNNLRHRGAQMLCNGLKMNRYLCVLNLEDNGIGDEGAVAVATLLSSNRTITHLNLRNNSIEEEGFIHLADALKQNNVIHTLLLSENKVKDKGAKAIANAIEDHVSLSNLELNSCGIGNEGAVGLAVALAANNSIKSIKLFNNYLSDEAGKSLMVMLERNSVLTKIDLRGNQIDHSTNLRIKKILQRNKTEKLLKQPSILKKEVIRLKYQTYMLTEAEATLRANKESRIQSEHEVQRIRLAMAEEKVKGDQTIEELKQKIVAEQSIKQDLIQKKLDKQAEREETEQRNKQKLYLLEMEVKKEQNQKEAAEKKLKEAKEEIKKYTGTKEEFIKEAEDRIEGMKQERQNIEKQIVEYKKKIADIDKKIAKAEKSLTDDQRAQLRRIELENERKEEERRAKEVQEKEAQKQSEPQISIEPSQTSETVQTEPTDVKSSESFDVPPSKTPEPTFQHKSTSPQPPPSLDQPKITVEGKEIEVPSGNEKIEKKNPKVEPIMEIRVTTKESSSKTAQKTVPASKTPKAQSATIITPTLKSDKGIVQVEQSAKRK